MKGIIKTTIKQTSLAALAGFALLVLALFISGWGNASFDFARIVFPYTMLSTYNNQPIHLSFIIVALLQYPLYWLIFNKFINYKYILLVILGVHLVFVDLAFKFSGSVFN